MHHLYLFYFFPVGGGGGGRAGGGHSFLLYGPTLSRQKTYLFFPVVNRRTFLSSYTPTISEVNRLRPVSLFFFFLSPSNKTRKNAHARDGSSRAWLTEEKRETARSLNNNNNNNNNNIYLNTIKITAELMWSCI